MALSFDTYTGTGSQVDFTVSFGYISQTHVDVYLDGVLKTVTTDYTWFNATTIRFGVAPGSGVVVRIERATPNTARLVDFQDAGNLTEADLDTSANQNFFLVQETVDGFDAEAMKLASDNKWDGESKVIKLVADPTSAQDVATKNYADGLYSSSLATIAAAVAATAADVVTTNADVVLTNADAASTAADAISTAADAAATAADLVQTNLDQISCAANEALTDADATATAADRVQTGLDATATAADAVSTAADAVSTAADAAATAADLVQTNLDQISCDADATAAAASAAAAAASEAAVDIAGHKNRNNIIINPEFIIWQRETPRVSPGNVFTADRWKINKSTGGAMTCASEGPASGDSEINNWMNWEVTTADASVAAGDFQYMQYRAEGHDIEHLKQGTADAKSFTLSFWHKHTVTGQYAVCIRDESNTISIIKEYTQSVSNTAEKAELTFTGTSSGTWNTSTGSGMQLLFVSMAGSTYQGTADTWQTGSAIATSSQANMYATIGNKCRWANVQLEVGTVATDFMRRLAAEELALCQRYYEKSYTYSTTPGSTSAIGAYRWNQVTDTTGTGTYCTGMRACFAVRKRVSPTMSWYSTLNGNVDKLEDITNGVERSIASTHKANVHTTGIPLLSASRVAGTILQGHWTADAEI